MIRRISRTFALGVVIFLLVGCFVSTEKTIKKVDVDEFRSRVALESWRFYKYPDETEADELIYDILPDYEEYNDAQEADTKPSEASQVDRENNRQVVLKPWILPTANTYIKDVSQHYQRPRGNPGEDFPFVRADYDDSQWESVNVPHDWAIAGPFYQGDDVLVGGGMGRLPSVGVGWYRKKIDTPESDKGRAIYLDFDGAMSYAMVWCNGELIGGWPYGYASWRVNLSQCLKYGDSNQISVRLSNPRDSSRWYPGAGLYRSVWLTKTHPVHIANWGTSVTTPEVTAEKAKVTLNVAIKNTFNTPTEVDVFSEIYTLANEKVATFETVSVDIDKNSSTEITAEAIVHRPLLWGPPPNQKPNLYVVKTYLKFDGKIIDSYQTKFGIRDIQYDANKGILVNNEAIYIQGANQHHDLGALGAAFNRRAAERQLEILREMGTNAIRIAHNPPAPELLELTDEMGFLVVNEIFDVWERKKAPYDFHLIFPDWSEADLRAFIRRDRNHPSVIMWSVGNEVGEQYTDKDGAAVGMRLNKIAKEEDPTRPTTASMNFAKPHMPFSSVMDIINLNYQGEGIRNGDGYSHLKGIRTSPLYPAFKKRYPDKVIISSENAAAVSSRGEYVFPVTSSISAPVEGKSGGNPASHQVSAYELYTTPFGSSADKVFGSLERHPYVAGGFVWSGWDYLGEPTPYYSSRSSYFGAIDLAGFKKDRFYLYQAHWRPDFPMAHILPHWNWPDRVGKITPVHVFTSGDEAELFLNGQSLGKKKKGKYQYRLRWDDVKYVPGELKVVVNKNGKFWAEDSVKTTGEAHALQLSVDRSSIRSDGKDLAFITAKVVDSSGQLVPTAKYQLNFSIRGEGEIIATDNGDSTDFTPFNSLSRKSFNGYALAIVSSRSAQSGKIEILVESEGLVKDSIVVDTKI